jgi:4-hydroxybenzoate polyprenyltransferase
MLRALLKTMRPRQWSKNVVVLAPLLFDRQLLNGPALARTLAAMLLFCMIASTIYLINDLADLAADRQHPKKRLRPIASGLLPIATAKTAAVILFLVTITLSHLLAPAFAAIIFAYFLMNLAYSKWLKHITFLDVLILAAGFVLRVAGGISVIHVQLFSPWLYVVITLGALYLGFGKRRAELALLADSANVTRRVLDGYSLPLLDQLITIVSSCTIVAYSLYTFSSPVITQNHIMMLTIPFVLYGVFRYLYLIQVKNDGGAPEEILLVDRPIQAAILLWGIAIFIILYIVDA